LFLAQYGLVTLSVAWRGKNGKSLLIKFSYDLQYFQWQKAIEIQQKSKACYSKK